MRIVRTKKITKARLSKDGSILPPDVDTYSHDNERHEYNDVDIILSVAMLIALAVGVVFILI